MAVDALSSQRLHHPCPYKRHHPVERCNCAQRLSVAVPHGYSRSGDQGSVHAARLQNLRWRYSSCGWAGDPSSLPASLCSLAEDLEGAASLKALRPLSLERRPKSQIVSRVALASERPVSPGLSRSSSGDYEAQFSVTSDPRVGKAFSDDQNEPPASEGSAPSKSSDKKRRAVSFHKRLETEVPLIVPCPSRPLRPVRPCDTTGAVKRLMAEDIARENLSRLVANHRKVSAVFKDCFAFLAKFMTEQDECEKIAATSVKSVFFTP